MLFRSATVAPTVTLTFARGDRCADMVAPTVPPTGRRNDRPVGTPYKKFEAELAFRRAELELQEKRRQEELEAAKLRDELIEKRRQEELEAAKLRDERNRSGGKKSLRRRDSKMS